MPAAQVAPPSADVRAVPAAPTATHALAAGHATPVRALAPVLAPPFHVEPSAVYRTTAAPLATAPTAVHALDDVQAMLLRFVVVPLVGIVQVWPPFVVLSNCPALPAA